METSVTMSLEEFELLDGIRKSLTDPHLIVVEGSFHRKLNVFQTEKIQEGIVEANERYSQLLDSCRTRNTYLENRVLELEDVIDKMKADYEQLRNEKKKGWLSKLF